MTLLHYSGEPFALDRDRVYRGPSRHSFKPVGLWVSVQGADDWEAWCRAEDFDIEKLTYVTEIVPGPSANILRIDNPDDLRRLTVKYPQADPPRLAGFGPVPDWERIAADFDGIVIAPYQWRERLNLHWYYGWDCASGCIWNLAAIQTPRSR